MFEFVPARYGVVVEELVDPSRLCELGPGQPNTGIEARIRSLSFVDLFPGCPIVNRDMASCCWAAIRLWHDFLDESHSISQSIEKPHGSYWHGIMHRREPDFANAKYWFRRVGRHPIFGELQECAIHLANQPEFEHVATDVIRQPSWDPFRFVDLCEAVAETPSPTAEWCRQIARLEWQLLFDYCYRNAVNGQTWP